MGCVNGRRLAASDESPSALSGIESVKKKREKETKRKSREKLYCCCIELKERNNRATKKRKRWCESDVSRLIFVMFKAREKLTFIGKLVYL